MAGRERELGSLRWVWRGLLGPGRDPALCYSKDPLWNLCWGENRCQTLASSSFQAEYERRTIEMLIVYSCEVEKSELLWCGVRFLLLCSQLRLLLQAASHQRPQQHAGGAGLLESFFIRTFSLEDMRKRRRIV